MTSIILQPRCPKIWSETHSHVLWDLVYCRKTKGKHEREKVVERSLVFTFDYAGHPYLLELLQTKELMKSESSNKQRMDELLHSWQWDFSLRKTCVMLPDPKLCCGLLQLPNKIT